MNTTPTLVVGASGKFAGYVVPALAKRAAYVRGMIRSEDDAARIRDQGAAEIVVADLTDPPSLARALDGVECVFYTAPAFMPRKAKVGRDFVATARNAGVRWIVFSSAVHPVINRLVNHATKAPVEEAILDARMKYSFLHPALYFQNFAAGWDKVVDIGTLAEPSSVETRFSRADYRDVTEVAAIALTEDRLLYGTFELPSGRWFNRRDAARLIEDALGRPIRAERVDPDPIDNVAAPMQAMFAHYDEAGLRGNTLTRRANLGREPRSFAAFFHELADRETTV
ncbi:NmrA/HSCARG family protein [Sphingobium fuliginis ATCC 27551]|nr:NmrA/HSCARG family protein [Sphingobium fuliginis ATCC 27551]QNG49127.1 NmrA family NAD(P)-binding protein [Sphingobium yanoikuyae]